MSEDNKLIGGVPIEEFGPVQCNSCEHFAPDETGDDATDGHTGRCRKHSPPFHPVRFTDRCGDFSHVGNFERIGPCFACVHFQTILKPEPWMERHKLRLALVPEQPGQESETGACGKRSPRAFIYRDLDGEEYDAQQPLVSGTYTCGEWAYDYHE